MKKTFNGANCPDVGFNIQIFEYDNKIPYPLHRKSESAYKAKFIYTLEPR